jgi:16S rRNA (adenine(1408)-N(1))-methyltransferase
MRLLQGTKVIEAPADWRDKLQADGDRVIIDVGSGDGRFVYELARRDPSSIYVALDPDAQALSEYAYRANRKPARGGVTNAIFVVASLEALPSELIGLADAVYVNFPWGGLLRGLLLPEAAALAGLVSLAREGGRFEIVLCFDPEHDAGVLGGESLPRLDEAYIDEALKPAYEVARLHVTERRRLSQEEALAIPSSWGRRLLHGRPREVFRIEGEKATP